jgi:hypothetical protein
MEITESEEQRRRRVASRIRNELLAHVAEDLVELARNRKLPDEWMSPGQVNRLLETMGYWSGHSHVMASFLSPGACEDLVAKALDLIAASHCDLWARAGQQFKPSGRDWITYAVQKANRIRRDFPAAERTAYHTGADGASVIFAHDDFTNDPRSREEVALLRKFLKDNGIPELGFGLSDEGRTWVMVVWSQDEAGLKKALFEAWQTAFSESEQIAF